MTFPQSLFKKNIVVFFKATLLLFLMSFYSKAQIQYNSVPDLPLNLISGSGTSIAGLADDNFVGAFEIGFSFTFFNNSYTQFFVGSNGIMSFGAGKAGPYGSILPISSAYNAICFANADLNCSVGTPSINYFTTGTAPNRILVLNFIDVRHFSNSANLTKVQVQLYETSNKIEIQCIANQSLGNNRTIGIQNSTGSSYSVVENNFNFSGERYFPTNGTTKVNFINRCVRFEKSITPPPQPSVGVSNGSACGTGTPTQSTLTATCSSSIFKQWSTGETNPSIDVVTTQTTLYTAFCEQNNVTNYTTFSIDHFSNPSISPNTNQNVCQNENLIINATVPVNPPLIPIIKWYKNDVEMPNETSRSLWVTESANYKMNYTMYGTCTFWSSSINVTILPIPSPPTVSVADTLISTCYDNNLLVNGCAVGFSVYKTYNDVTSYWGSSSLQSLNLNQLGTYTAKCVAANGCYSNTSNNSVKMGIAKADIQRNAISQDYFTQTCNMQADSLEVKYLPNIATFDFKWYKNDVFVKNGTKSIFDGYGAYRIDVLKKNTNCVVVSDLVNFIQKTNFNTITAEICGKTSSIPLNVPPTPIWNVNYSGGSIETVNSALTGSDYLVKMIANDDETYLLCGNSNSQIGNAKSQARRGIYSNPDYWIVKINRFGTKIWDKTFGGSGYEDLRTAIKTPDGGYLLGGTSASSAEYDVSENALAYTDIWLVKIDSLGNKMWDKKIGSSSSDYITDIALTNDGGYLIGSYTDAGIGFNKSVVSKGGQDMWLIKIDNNGIKVWDKVYGGSSTDYLTSIAKASDGYLLSGYTYSPISGDVSEVSRGGADFWCVKIDENGTKVWDKRIGGNASDFAQKSLRVSNGFLLGGNTLSPASGDKTAISGGANNQQMWVIKIGDTGNLLWDKTFGNGGTDLLKTLKTLSDSTYLVGGIYSNAGQDDFFVNKIDNNGNQNWEKLVGSSQNDAMADAVLTPDNGLLLGGSTFGSVENSGDRTNGAILDDFWLIKIADCASLPNPVTITEGETVRLKTTGYTFPCGVDKVVWSNGVQFNITEVKPVQTTAYTVRCYDPASQCYGNIGTVLNVIVTCINAKILQSPQNNYDNKTVSVKVNNTINATNKILGNTSNIIYQAGKSITLEPGFNVEANAIFKAIINNCN
jgi:hypothetical protein